MFGIRIFSVATIAFGLMAGSANAVSITSFSDTFDGETSALNATLSQWNITVGSIDVVNHLDFGINCAGASGKCLDLDGSTGTAGTIETMDDFMIGTYALTFDFRGNDRNGNSDTMTVLFGDLNESFSKLGTDGYSTIMRTVVLTSAGKLSFSHAGGDNVGLILDNVSVRRIDEIDVPEPATFALFGIGLAGLGIARRRKAA